MEAFSRLPIKIRVPLVTIVLLGLLFSLDRLVFGFLFFEFPNEVEWGESPWYAFQSQIKRLKENTKKPPSKILVVGSSVALYSVLPEWLNARSKGQYSVSFFSHVAMAPTDAYYYLPDLLETKPDQVYYFLNFGDFQWEHTQIDQAKVQFNFASWVSDFSQRNPAKSLYPFAYLKDHFLSLNKKEKWSLVSRSLLKAIRVRNYFWDPFETWIENHFRSGRSYANYLGTIPVEGIWSRGWVGKKASLVCDTRAIERNAIFFPKENGAIQLKIWKLPDQLISKESIPNHTKENAADLELVVTSEKPGWLNLKETNLLVDLKRLVPDNQKFILGMELQSETVSSHSIDLYKYGKEYQVGFRLSQGFCLAEPLYENQSYVRNVFFEDQRLESMSSEEYDLDYYQRFEEKKEDRPALNRLNLIHDRKQTIADFSFESFPEIDRILQIHTILAKNGIDMVVVLSPDNPLESQLYSQKQWFRGLVSFLEANLDPENKGGRVLDWTEKIPRKQRFLDPHHLTYFGALELSTLLEERIQKALGATGN